MKEEILYCSKQSYYILLSVLYENSYEVLIHRFCISLKVLLLVTCIETMKPSILLVRLAILSTSYLSKCHFVQAVETSSVRIDRNTRMRKKSRVTFDDIVDTTDVQESYYQQRLDHFASHPSMHQRDFLFSQRYFYSSRYISIPNNNVDHRGRAYLRGKETRQTLAFLCVGGEGPSLTKNVLVNSVHCTGDMLELASKMNKELNTDVHLFALEHRYYGESYPKFTDGSSPISNSNFVYLSSRQALGDIANFIQFVRGEYKIGEQVNWVTFGGSYPGMLAAWVSYSLFVLCIHLLDDH